jgi:hypothetical protein
MKLKDVKDWYSIRNLLISDMIEAVPIKFLSNSYATSDEVFWKIDISIFDRIQTFIQPIRRSIRNQYGNS